MALILEQGNLTAQATIVPLSGARTARSGAFMPIGLQNVKTGARPSRNAYCYKPADEITGTQLSVPGFALRKNLRVMTLVDNKVMAFRNIIE